MTIWTTRTRVAVLWNGCDPHEDLPFLDLEFFSTYQTQIPRNSKPCVAWLAHLKQEVPDEAPVTFHSGPEQGPGSAYVSLGRGISNCHHYVTFLVQHRCTSRKTMSNHRGLSALALEKSLFLPLFGDLCLIPAGEELVYDSWLEREAEPESFGRGLRMVLAAGALKAQAAPQEGPQLFPSHLYLS